MLRHDCGKARQYKSSSAVPSKADGKRNKPARQSWVREWRWADAVYFIHHSRAQRRRLLQASISAATDGQRVRGDDYQRPTPSPPISSNISQLLMSTMPSIRTLKIFPSECNRAYRGIIVTSDRLGVGSLERRFTRSLQTESLDVS